MCWVVRVGDGIEVDLLPRFGEVHVAGDSWLNLIEFKMCCNVFNIIILPF